MRLSRISSQRARDFSQELARRPECQLCSLVVSIVCSGDGDLGDNCSMRRHSEGREMGRSMGSARCLRGPAERTDYSSPISGEYLAG